MRIASYILATYMLILALMPCADGLSVLYPECTSSINIEENSHNHSDHEHEDLCSPFCVCSCCGSLSIIPGTVEYYYSVDIISTDCIFTYQFSYSFDFNKGEWHPPAIS